MATELTCPVCGLEHLAADRDKCPQCDADLTCFKILNSLPDELPGEEHKQARATPVWAFAVIFAGLTAVVIVFQLYWFERYELLLRDHQAAFADSMQNLTAALGHLAQDRREPQIPDPEPSRAAKSEQPDLRTYRVRHGDTLWSISKRHYGSGHYYPVLLEHNPHLRIYALARGMEVKMLEDAGGAKKIYEAIVTREVDGTYWNYAVTQGDTLKSVGRRYYQTGNLERLLFNLNPGLELKEGQKVKIRLE